MNEHLAADQHFATKDFVTIREGTWRLRDQCGPVETLIPVRCSTAFSEIAVLAFPDTDRRHYAARVAHTDDWAHFHYLQPWMQPFVEHYLTTLSRYSQIVELVEQTHRLTQ